MTFQEQKAKAIEEALLDFQEAVARLSPLDNADSLILAGMAFGAFKMQVFLILQRPDPDKLNKFPKGGNYVGEPKI